MIDNMKLIKSIIFGGFAAAALSLASCGDWLDVNIDPNTASDQSAAYYQRLSHIQFYTNHAMNIGAQPVAMLCGDLTATARTSNQGKYAQWQMSEWRTTTVYQWWYVGAACNLGQMIDFALEDEAYHYAGVGYLIKALGFAMMNDLHGELPYSDALGENVTPVYDTGKEMFQHTLEDIDQAIEYLSMTQGPNAVPLSANDIWAQGNVDKWLKFAYLLKARQLNHLIKKGAGSAADLKYDANEILACLDKAQKSNADNIIYNPTDSGTTPSDNLGWDEPTDWSGLYSCIGMNSGYYFTRTLFENLTDFGGYGVEDPRADKILPWARSKKGTGSDRRYEQDIKWSDNGLWRRTIGVDMNTTIRTNGNIEAPSGFENGGYVIKIENHEGDTVFVDQRSRSTGYEGKANMFRYIVEGNEGAALSGSFYTRATSPHFIASYAEACFIRAEVLFNQGNTSGAFEAYKNGIKANIDCINDKLSEWVSQDANYAGCPSMTPMTEADINNFLNNGIGTSGDLTLGKILTQKHIAMLFTIEQWNDMRRYDYDESLFLNWHVPAEYYINADAQLTIPMGKQPRRWRVSSHEYNYNTANLNAIGEKVVGATSTNGSFDNWWNADDMWTIPVWWDSDQQ